MCVSIHNFNNFTSSVMFSILIFYLVEHFYGAVKIIILNKIIHHGFSSVLKTKDAKQAYYLIWCFQSCQQMKSRAQQFVTINQTVRSFNLVSVATKSPAELKLASKSISKHIESRVLSFGLLLVSLQVCSAKASKVINWGHLCCY